MIYLIVCLFILFDFVSGLLSSLMNKRFNSRVMRVGLYHKTALILCMMFGILVDYAQTYIDIGVTIPVGISICAYITLMEIGSIIENLCSMNSELAPEKLKQFFEKLK